MTMPSANEYKGTLSGIPEALEFPKDADFGEMSEAEIAAYLQEVRQHYAPQYAMILRVALLAKKQLEVLKDLQAELQLITSQGWENYTDLPPAPLEGKLRPLAVTKLAPAMGAAMALITFLDTPLQDLGNQKPIKCFSDLAIVGV